MQMRDDTSGYWLPSPDGTSLSFAARVPVSQVTAPGATFVRDSHLTPELRSHIVERDGMRTIPRGIVADLIEIVPENRAGAAH